MKTPIQPIGPNQEKWLRALESGRYKRGKGYLHSDGHYCCLGVGCKIYRIGHLECAGESPLKLVRKLALIGSMGENKNNEFDSLATFNDSGKTFAEIAAIVRADPGAYFSEPR